MRYFVRTSIPRERGTLLREEPGQVPEILRQDTLRWTAHEPLFQATFMTDDWDEITLTESQRIEAHQMVGA